MTLRGPAAHLRKPPTWRRSGDESSWETLVSEGEVLPRVSRPPRAPRPQSAIEGGQLDRWLEHLQRIQDEPLRVPVHDQVPAFNDYTTSLPNLHKDAPGRNWRQQTVLPSSRGSSSCGSPSFCESSFGSQESFPAGIFSPPERRGSWERAHIMQTPKTEQTQLSNLAPVKIGWLPIQRKVMVGGALNKTRTTDLSAGQVKLKQPITPTFQKSPPTANWCPDDKVERSHTSVAASTVRTWQAPDQGSPIIKQAVETCSSPANDGDKPVTWQALKRGWKINRVSSVPGGSQSTTVPTGTSSDPQWKTLLTKTTAVEPFRHFPLERTTSAKPCRDHTHNRTEQSPLQRTSSVQPLKPHPSHIHTSSVATTLIPQNKAGFSSITISSKKVSRSASLPGNQPMDAFPQQVTVERKATIVKVTEQRVTTNPKSGENQSTGHALDTVVHRRKATIIKVTEHRESYSPAKNKDYRHSYSEGLYQKNSIWTQGDHVQNHGAMQPPAENPADVPQDPEKNESLHRSTLNLFVSSPPPEALPRPRSGRPPRPMSCYGAVLGHSEPNQENVRATPARKWSLGLPQEAGISPVNPDRSSTRPGTALTEAGQPMTDAFQPRKHTPAVPGSPGLTLIKAPDPSSRQTPEDVLALNAAAIIANIKLQRKLSKKKTPNGACEQDSPAPPRGPSVTRDGESVTPGPDQSRRHVYQQPHAGFVPLSPDSGRSAGTVSLQEALQRSRPDFISRSQHRLRELERRAQKRRGRTGSAKTRSEGAHGHRRLRPSALTDNLFRPRDRAITGKEMQLRSERTFAEVKKKKEEETKKREVCLSNRQRVELFKKKLLDQILQRSNE